MSQVKIQGNVSGTGTFTIAAPNSNSDRTLNLPDGSGTINTSGAPNEVPAGSASAPAIYPTGDTNTGIFFPAADTIGFAEGGAEIARFASNGSLLVNTTTNTNNSRVVVNGVIESTSGGVRFPDGTTQTTAAGAVTTTAVLNATAGAAAGAIGSYALVINSTNSSQIAGNTVAGSNLEYGGAINANNGSGFDTLFIASPGATLSGTWRYMGTGYTTSGLVPKLTLALRIS